MEDSYWTDFITNDISLLPIHTLLVGAVPTERHIIEYRRSHPNEIITTWSNDLPDSDYHIGKDFNDLATSKWMKETMKYKHVFHKIIIDHSTIKIIQEFVFFKRIQEFLVRTPTYQGLLYIPLGYGFDHRLISRRKIQYNKVKNTSDETKQELQYSGPFLLSLTEISPPFDLFLDDDGLFMTNIEELRGLPYASLQIARYNNTVPDFGTKISEVNKLHLYKSFEKIGYAIMEQHGVYPLNSPEGNICNFITIKMYNPIINILPIDKKHLVQDMYPIFKKEFEDKQKISSGGDQLVRHLRYRVSLGKKSKSKSKSKSKKIVKRKL